MKFNININQSEIIRKGYKIDVLDACILDFCLDFSHSERITKLTDKGTVYYWFDYKNISEQMPILNLKKDSIYRRMKNLSEIGFLRPHPNNQELGRPYYALTGQILELRFKSDTTDENPNPYGLKSEPPTDENPNNNNINNNTIKNSLGASSLFPDPENEIKTEPKIKPYTEWNYNEFRDELKKYRGKYSDEMLKAFLAYWSEPTKNGKMRFQLEKTWGVPNRLAGWFSRDKSKR